MLYFNCRLRVSLRTPTSNELRYTNVGVRCTHPQPALNSFTAPKTGMTAMDTQNIRITHGVGSGGNATGSLEIALAHPNNPRISNLNG